MAAESDADERLLARIIYGCRSETAETEAGHLLLPKMQRVMGFSQARATQAYSQQYVEETEREQPRRARGSAVVVGIHE
jgi:hypothetical protein